MKSKFTLTTLCTLAILLVSLTVVSAATLEDDSCKTKCCKNKKSKKTIIAAAEIDKIFENLNSEISYVTALVISKELKNNLKTLRLKKAALTSEIPTIVFAFDVVEENTLDAKHKIDFGALDKEMNKVQEDLSKLEENKIEASQKIDFTALDEEMNHAQEELSKMDDRLKNDDAKNRKPAEEILKTGIKY